MKMCPNCQNAMNDDVVFCTNCGCNLSADAQSSPAEPIAPVQPEATFYQQNQGQAYQQQMPNGIPVPPVVTAVDSRDHTAEFDAKDISDNKVFAMIAYLMGIVGVAVALIASSESKYTRFHVTQSLKIIVCNTLLSIATALVAWTIVGAFAGGVCMIILFVLKIMCFVDVCNGKAKEPAIICGFGFLK